MLARLLRFLLAAFNWYDARLEPVVLRAFSPGRRPVVAELGWLRRAGVLKQYWRMMDELGPGEIAGPEGDGRIAWLERQQCPVLADRYRLQQRQWREVLRWYDQPAVRVAGARPVARPRGAGRPAVCVSRRRRRGGDGGDDAGDSDLADERAATVTADSPLSLVAARRRR